MVPLVVLAGACSDEGDSGRGSDVGLRSLSAALEVLPESGEEVETVLWGDLVTAAELTGFDRPDDPSDEEAVADYLVRVTAGRTDSGPREPVLVVPPDVAGVERSAGLDAFAEELGWSILDVDRFVERRTPLDVVTVLEGSFDEGRFDQAMGEPSEGMWVAGDPDAEDFEQDLDGATAARPLGVSLWHGLAGDLLSVAPARGTAAAARDAAAGDSREPALADDEALAGLAEGLDAQDPYAALLVRPGLDLAANVPAGAQPAGSSCDHALPEATTAVATGIAADAGRLPVYLVALAHETAAAADANGNALERIVADGVRAASNQPWSELVTVEGVDVSDDGLVVVARLRPIEPSPGNLGPPTLWYDLIIQRDALVAHC